MGLHLLFGEIMLMISISDKQTIAYFYKPQINLCYSLQLNKQVLGPILSINGQQVIVYAYYLHVTVNQKGIRESDFIGGPLSDHKIYISLAKYLFYL